MKTTPTKFTEWLMDVVELHDDFNGEIFISFSDDSFRVENEDGTIKFRVTVTEEK